AADYDGSGWPSLWVTNFEGQWHGLYRNQGGGSFIFSSPGAGIAALAQQFVGFGTAFLDLDRHGWEDLFIVDGHVYRYPRRSPLSQPPVLLRNCANGRYADISAQGGEYFRSAHSARGLAMGDLDNDG